MVYAMGNNHRLLKTVGRADVGRVFTLSQVEIDRVVYGTPTVIPKSCFRTRALGLCRDTRLL